MKHVLFVDDESNVLEGLENILFPYMDQWSVALAESGMEALLQLEKQHFDVIVTDMRMPSMDGATLLHFVREHYPNIVRIVLSGQSELGPALRTMPIAHQFLSKPCNADKLVEVLNRACTLQVLINDKRVRGLLGGIDTLPARPRIYSEITKLLEDEEFALDDVAAIVEKDIGISTKMLQVANTAFFSRGNNASSVRDAVMRLGINIVKSLALGVEVFREFGSVKLKGFSIDELHEHSFRTADIAQRLLDDPRKAEDAYLAGTLHDVGKLIFASVLPEQFAAALQESTRTGQPLSVVEAACAEFGHAEIGAYVLGLWGLQYPVVEAVAYHHSPQRAGSDSFDVVGAVYVANILAHELESGRQSTSIDLDYLNSVGVADRLDDWRQMLADDGEKPSAH